MADQGYHSNKTMVEMKERGWRTYVSEPRRGRRKWKRKREPNRSPLLTVAGPATAASAGGETRAHMGPPVGDWRAAARLCTRAGGDPKTDTFQAVTFHRGLLLCQRHGVAPAELAGSRGGVGGRRPFALFRRIRRPLGTG